MGALRRAGAASVRCVLALMAASVIGCGPKGTRFDIVDYRVDGHADRYFQRFDECYYSYDGRRSLHVVAQRETTSDAGLPTRQIVHLETFWNASPGRTMADETMINATVSYMILSGPTGGGFEGSGFLSFRENRGGTEITGKLELSSLTPHRRLGSADRLFDRAELSGHFSARRDDAKVVALLNEMRRIFGPMPRYIAPPNNPDLR